MKPQKITRLSITALIIFFFFAVTVQSEGNVLDRPKIPYEWGNMRMFHQIMSEKRRDAHFNETVDYEFDFSGYRTTYNLKIEDYQGDGQNPCTVQPRYVDIEFDRLDTELGLPKHSYVAMHSFQNYLVTLTHEYKIFIFFISQLPYLGLNLQFLNQVQIPENLISPFDIQTQNTTITSSYNGKFVHILFPHIMFSFKMPEDSTYNTSNQEINLLVNQEYKNKRNVVASKFLKGYLFVSTSQDGIDVYRVENKVSATHSYVTTLNSAYLKLSNNLNALDLAIDYSSRLYIVCSNNGVIIYDIDEKDFSRSSILHIIGMLKNASQIAVRGDHTLVVSGNEGSNYFIKEVFYDIETNDYFINRQFIDTEFKWSDIQMGDLFTFIQGKGAHRILYQGVNKQLIPQEDKHSDFRQGVALQELDLYEVKQIQSVQYGQTSFIAISETGIFGIELKEIPPKISCQATQRSNIGENKMRLVYNSTDCNLANFHSPILYNVWQMCQTDFQFTFVVHDIWIDGQNISVAGFIAAIIILSFIIIFILVFYFYKQYKNKFIQTETELTDIKQKYFTLESRSITQQKDQTIIQDRSALHFNNNNQLDNSSLK